MDDKWQGIIQFLLFFLRCWRKLINEILKYHTSICGWLYLGVRRMEITRSTLEAHFSKSFGVRKLTNFAFLAQLLRSRFYFKRTHINALFRLYFIVLEKLFESIVRCNFTPPPPDLHVSQTYGVPEENFSLGPPDTCNPYTWWGWAYMLCCVRGCLRVDLASANPVRYLNTIYMHGIMSLVEGKAFS